MTGRSRSSNSEARSRLRDRNQSDTNRSHRSYSSEPRAVDSEPSPHSTMPSQKSSNRPTSELDTRLHDIRARVREACVRSLILTNRVHSLVQQITLEQIRAQGSWTLAIWEKYGCVWFLILKPDRRHNRRGFEGMFWSSCNGIWLFTYLRYLFRFYLTA